MKKELSVEQRLEKRRRLTAVGTALAAGVLGAAVFSLGMTLAVTGASALLCAGGAIAALPGLGVLAAAYPLYRTISGGKNAENCQSKA